jgi:predicted DCC family thiol-disulfide oxidoreductase YuxK
MGGVEETRDSGLDLPLLLFDGECRFCSACIEWLASRLERRTRLLPWQAADLDALGVTEREARRTVWWIEPSGERFPSAQAVARALIACGSGWRRLGLLLLTPGIRTLGDAAYYGIARIRHRLPGTTPACSGNGGMRVVSPSRGPGRP